MAKNILFIHHNASAYGGGEESLFLLLSKLDRTKFNPILLCTSEGVLFEKVKSLGIEVKVIDAAYIRQIGRFKFLLLLYRLCLFVKKQKIKLIHINSLGKLHYLTLFCKLIGIRSVYHLRSLLVIKAISKRTCFIMNCSNKIIAHCKHMKKAAIEKGIKDRKITIVYNGIDTEKFNPEISGDKFRIKFNIDESTCLIGMIARIVPWKGCDDFIKAAAEVIKVIPNSKFVIVGEAPERVYLDKLIKLSRKLKREEKIIFTGLYSDMLDVYGSLDLFVLPSWEEPFGRVILEAMSMAKPIVATNTGGTPEQIFNNVTGILVPPKDHISLANGIIKILQNRKMAEKMGIAGRKWVEKCFGINQYVTGIENLYKNLIKNQKILIYTHEFPPISGGAGRYSYEIAEGLSKSADNISILTTKRNKEDCKLDLGLPFKIYRMPKVLGNKERLLGLCQFIWFYLKLKPDWVVITDKWAQEVCSLVCLLFPFKYIVTIHGSEVLINNMSRKSINFYLRKYLFRQLCLRAKYIIAVSQYTKKLLVVNKIPPSKINVISNCINIKKWSVPINIEKVSAIKDNFNISGSDKIILTLSVLKPRKGHDMVLRALSSVLEIIPNVKYVIVGDGEDLNRLYGIVDKYNLNKNVIFAGNIDDDEIIHFYDMCDVFVMPSRQDRVWVEGFGISFLESNARGKAVIGGKHGGVPEAIIHNETGILVDPYDNNDIAQSIVRLLSNDELAKTMGEKGRDRCFQFFNKNIVINKMVKLLN